MRYQVVVEEGSSDARMVPLEFVTEELPGKPVKVAFQSNELDEIDEMLVVARYFYRRVAVIDTEEGTVINHL